MTNPPPLEAPEASRWIAQLDLEPNMEGGYYRQTFASATTVDTGPTSSDPRPRPLLTTIYYLLTPSSPVGHLHLNRSDITHFYHRGGPAHYTLVSPDGELREVVLGADWRSGEVVSFTAPGGWWKASSIRGHETIGCLISEAVAPGFSYDDHEMATVEGIAAVHPLLLDRLRPLILASASANP